MNYKPQPIPTPNVFWIPKIPNKPWYELLADNFVNLWRVLEYPFTVIPWYYTVALFFLVGSAVWFGMWFNFYRNL